jgi:hypothetical protein
MKLLSEKLILILVPIFLLGSCQKTYTVSKSQDILFQYEFIRTTGTYAHWGIFVDARGNILTFNLPEKWNFPKEDQTITQKELLEDVSLCKLTGKKIPAAELQKHINSIDNIAASKVSSPKKSNSESGIGYFYCYQFSESSLTYKRSIIKTEGDLKCENLNFYTRKLVTWMNEIRKGAQNSLAGSD